MTEGVVGRQGRVEPPLPLPRATRLVGPHLPLSAGLLRAADRAAAVGATCVQVFADNPTAWRRKPEPPGQIEAFRERLAELGIEPLAVHGPYLINLAGPEDRFWRRSVDTLAAELRMAAAYGGAFVNIHIGSHLRTSHQAGLDRLARGVEAALAEVASEPAIPSVVLENSAGGAAIGGTMDELAEIAAALRARGVPDSRFGFCLDTAHLWAAGHDLREPSGVDAALRSFDRTVGLQNLRMVHLNDSRAALGSAMDRHEHIGAGSIGPAGIRAVLQHPALGSVPMFLETPGMDIGYDAVNMDRVRRLLSGEPLPELPDEAFTVRGSRSRMGRRPAREEEPG